ncbi:hypothetical protein ACGC1H_003254 [Rhizoctonia solani]
MMGLSRARPGDYLKPGEDESEGLKARLDERLAPLPGSAQHLGHDGDWEIGDCLAQWWRPNFETFMVGADILKRPRLTRRSIRLSQHT